MTDLSLFHDDAPQDNATSLRIRVPIIGSPFPRWRYITAVVVSDLYEYIQPSDEELRIVGSFHDEYVSHWLRPGWVSEMRRKYIFDVDGGAVGRYLMKYQNGGWGFRRSTWESPTSFPGPNRPPRSLMDILDRIHTMVDEVSPRWTQWKSEHPETFAAVTK